MSRLSLLAPRRRRGRLVSAGVLGMLLAGVFVPPIAHAETLLVDRGKEAAMTVGETRLYPITGSGVADGFSLSTNFESADVQYGVRADTDTLRSQWLYIEPSADRASQEGNGADLSVFRSIYDGSGELVQELYLTTALVRIWDITQDEPGDFRGRLKIGAKNSSGVQIEECLSDVIEPSPTYVAVAVQCLLPVETTHFNVAFRARQQDRLLGGTGLGQELPTDNISDAYGYAYLRELTVTRLQ